MNTDPDPSKPSDTPKRREGILAKCGIALHSLSVRDRQVSEDNSEENPNRLVMSVADRKDKKRKRRSSLQNNRRVPVPLEKPDIMPPSVPQPVTLESPNARRLLAEAFQDVAALEHYKSRHNDLLLEESKIAWDRRVRPLHLDQLSADEEIEQLANQILVSIREYERDVLFGNLAGEELPGPETLDMGGQFLTNKQRIEKQSILYQLSKLVPKGALLHLHFNAELHPERLLEEARTMPNMYVRSIRPLLNEKDLAETEMVFNVVPIWTPSADIFSKGYVGAEYKKPKTTDPVWMRWDEFRRKFQVIYGEKYKQNPKETANDNAKNCAEPGHVELEPAENWIKQKMVLSVDEAYDPKQTVNGVWARFNQATRCFKGLLNYEKVYKWYIGQAIDRLIDEKVMYAELRPMLLDKFIPNDAGEEGQITNRQQMRLIVEAVQKKKEQLEREGRADDFPFGLKIIYCTPRSIPTTMMRKELEQCIELKLEFKDLICGFDLVGAEDRKNHIGFYAQELLAFRNTCKQLDLDIPFMFHAGETLLDTGGSKDPANSNLYDAQLLESKRIGHGFSLMKHPHLVEKFRWKENEKGEITDKGICVELCPISNELLHLCRNIKEHPYPELLAAGIPCTVNSDNPSLFSNSMSHEFYQMIVGSPAMTIYGWKQLALWSIEYSCLNDKQKEDGTQIYLNTWKRFCADLVREYGELLVDGKLDEKKAKQAYESASKAL